MSVKRDTAINLFGSATSMAVSFVCVPLYLRRIGDARFGVLAIVWLLLGYFGIFDFGISRAAANQISRLHAVPAQDKSRVFWTAVALNGLFGVVGGAFLYSLGAWLIAHEFRMPETLRSEVLPCLPWLAFAVPLATVSGVLVGVLEGCERFATVNVIQTTGSALFQLAPLAVAYLHGPQLRWLIISALIARAASFVPLFIASRAAISLTWAGGPTREWARRLSSYGGWVAVNSLLSPLFSSLDRFLIGAGVGAPAVAIYTVPYNLVHRLQVVPGALARTLFPRFSALAPAEATDLAKRSVNALAAVTVPFAVLGTLIMHPFLSFWIGSQFAERASGVGEALILGVWMSSLALVPYVFLQGQMRPRTVAIVHLTEAPVLAMAIWLGIRVGGILGAACIMSVRDLVDALAFMTLSGLLPGIVRQLSVGGAWLAAALALVSINGASRSETLTVGSALVLGSVAWSFRVEPLIRDAVPRARLWAQRLVTG